MAITHALAILSFQEMPDERRPPERIWLDDEALREHFEELKRKDSEKSGSESVPELEQNELTKGLLRR